jgi:hypothetical protein
MRHWTSLPITGRPHAEECVSYQGLQWFDPDLVVQCIFPRADAQIPMLLEAMKASEGARQFLGIQREDRLAEELQAEVDTLRASTTPPPTWTM